MIHMLTELARRTFRRLALETRATEIAEAAAVLPLMFMMLLGILWFGQAFSIYGAITRAAQEGARAGAAPYCTTCSGSNSPTTNVTNAVNNVLRSIPHSAVERRLGHNPCVRNAGDIAISISFLAAVHFTE